MVQNTLKSFLDRSAKTISSLRSAAEGKDYVKLRRDAHSLKGACGYVKSDHVHASAYRLQLAAESAQKEEESQPPLDVCLSHLLTDLGCLCAAIEKALGEAGDLEKVAELTIS